MASFVIDGVDDIIKELERLGDIDDVAVKIVDEAAEIMDAELKTAISSSTQKYGTGELAASIHHNKPKKNSLGIFTASTARGKDHKGVRNHDKLYYHEYGTSKQPARPIVQKCVNEAEPKVLEKMQEVFNREVNL